MRKIILPDKGGSQPGFGMKSLRLDRSVGFRHRSTATGFTILGISGVGKSTTIEQILHLYPQVIYHTQYRDRNSTNTQLVWLKLECPADGSIKGLCLNFFQAVDDILGTSYYEIYGGRGRKTVNEMMPNMARVASNVHLGVLVIDEIQSLTKLKFGGYEKILDFFVQLINTIGLPVVLVGTYKAWSVLSSEFRQIRRGTGQGDFIWNRMQEDADWQLFVESLWQYQYVRQPCELNQQLSHALYYECQGITDLAVKIFMLAQVRAITTGLEKLTPAIIKSVARDCLRTAREVLDALKLGSLSRLKNCEDVRPIDIEPFIEEALSHLPVEDQFRNLPATQETENKSHEKAKVQASPRKRKTKSTFKKSHQPLQERSLPEIVLAKEQCGITAYEALQEAGYIRSATEYLL